MFPSTATGYVDYKYEVNLTNNATAIEIDFIVEAQNVTNSATDL